MAAKAQQVVSYDMLAKMTGVARFGFAAILGNIYHYCEQSGLPPLTSIVVDEKTGKPATAAFHDTDVLSAHVRVFVFDWLSHGAPSVKDFENARGKMEATGAAQNLRDE